MNVVVSNKVQSVNAIIDQFVFSQGSVNQLSDRTNFTAKFISAFMPLGGILFLPCLFVCLFV